MIERLNASDWSVSLYEAAVSLTEVFEQAPEGCTDACMAGVYEYMANQAVPIAKQFHRLGDVEEADRFDRLHSQYRRQQLLLASRLHSSADDGPED